MGALADMGWVAYLDIWNSLMGLVLVLAPTKPVQLMTLALWPFLYMEFFELAPSKLPMDDISCCVANLYMEFFEELALQSEAALTKLALWMR